ncbi:histone acetyltransferase type B catalytic subunit [Ischnura elegans]|uniref:histone acetyltransferase type B catalytic subunit n=1 Tax=Ischnura elegans TaxID=197161 RepID=UPI001ED8930B|nr:histone acetyltransferase type B catalytic subunit [Ischnura elegans]
MKASQNSEMSLNMADSLSDLDESGDEDSQSRDPLEEYVSDANKALEFKLIRREADIEDDKCTFNAEMSHQVFGEGETIFGYKNPRVQLYYTAARLTTYMGMSYSEKMPKQDNPEVVADEVLSMVSEYLPPGFFTKLSDLRASLPKDDNFTPYGELIHSFDAPASSATKLAHSSDKNCDSMTSKYEIYMCSMESCPAFRPYHERLQTFVLWYVDGASFIDADDPRWRFFVVYERYRKASETAETVGGGRWMYAICGYATVYQYYAYPMNMRPRVAQALILPLFQGNGLGAELLSAISSHYARDPTVSDMTVEDSSEDFQRVRDYLDAISCISLPAFSPSLIKKGFSSEMVEQARKKFKIHKKQVRRVYEILRLRLTDRENKEEYRAYRLEIKNRLNGPFVKEQKTALKVQKLMDAPEVAQRGFLSDEERIQSLVKLYNELEEQYLRVVARLDREGKVWPKEVNGLAPMECTDSVNDKSAAS